MDTGTRHDTSPISYLPQQRLNGERVRLKPRRGGKQRHVSPRITDGLFTMADGAVLPYREWLPSAAPDTVVLALHGINDCADAWEAPSAHFVAAGIGVIAPDQRGFGAAAGRGRWHGTEAMVQDALTMVAETRARFPAARLFLAGESMGAAILMVLAARHPQLPVAGYVLSAPAVWGRQEMAAAFRLSLWWAHKTVPWLRLSATRLGIKAGSVRRRSSFMAARTSWFRNAPWPPAGPASAPPAPATRSSPSIRMDIICCSATWPVRSSPAMSSIGCWMRIRRCPPARMIARSIGWTASPPDAGLNVALPIKIGNIDGLIASVIL
jgi:pimeloyl-ACP methyl ester carboxylesterase